MSAEHSELLQFRNFADYLSQFGDVTVTAIDGNAAGEGASNNSGKQLDVFVGRIFLGTIGIRKTPFTVHFHGTVPTVMSKAKDGKVELIYTIDHGRCDNWKDIPFP